MSQSSTDPNVKERVAQVVLDNVSRSKKKAAPFRARLFLHLYHVDLESRQNHKLVATILRAARLFAIRGARGALFAVAHHLESRRIDPAFREVPVCNCRTPLAQGHVVFVRSTVIGIAFDSHANRRVALERFYFRIEKLETFIGQLRAIELEPNRRCNRCLHLRAGLCYAIGVSACGSGAICFLAKSGAFTIGCVGGSAIRGHWYRSAGG